VVWLKVNLTHYNENTYDGATYDIPSMRLYGQSGTVMIPDYPSFALNSNKTMNLPINLGSILNAYSRIDEKPRSGYITKGDNNPIIDQPDVSLPVTEKWIKGKAGGEVPWLGLVSLIYRDNPDPIPRNSWFWLFTTLGVLFGISITMEIIIKSIRKRRKERKERSEKAKYQRYGTKYFKPERRDVRGERRRNKPEDPWLRDKQKTGRSGNRRRRRSEKEFYEESYDERDDEWEDRDEYDKDYDDYSNDGGNDWKDDDEYEEDFDDHLDDEGNDWEESDDYETLDDEDYDDWDDDWEEGDDYDTGHDDRRSTGRRNRDRKRSRRGARDERNDWSEDFFLR